MGLPAGKKLDCPGRNLDPYLHEKISMKKHLTASELPESVINELGEEVKKLSAALRQRVQLAYTKA